MTALRPLGPPSSQAERPRPAQRLIDPVTHEWMIDAVTLTQCGHTLSQRTADSCLERNLPCPIGNPHPVSPYVPNLNTRQIVQYIHTEAKAKIPATLRERITSLPLYIGDAGTAIPFTPVAEKTGGCAIGT